MRRLALALLALIASVPALAQGTGGEPVRIFFDWGKPELTRDAETTLDEAVAAYRQSQPGQITVTGHTDRSGSAAYNLAASRRRAEAVKEFLVARGIPAGAIAVAAFGESRPIIATADGVREAQNRRVEISFPRTASVSAVGALSATIVRADGSRAGAASLTETGEGAWLTIDAQGLPPGLHGAHLHAVGTCEAPEFTSAGPHWNPTAAKHGLDNAQGPHRGDLPNVTVGPEGKLKATLKLARGSVDDDGAALVIHASADDGRTDPSGNSGARIACAAFTR